MKHIFWICVLVFMVMVPACNEPTRFDSAAMSGQSAIEKNAGNYWKRDNWWGGLPKDVKKVAISQFSVEFVTENVSKSGADALSVLGVLEMGGMGRRQRQFPDDFKREFPNRLYQGFVEALKAEGIEAVPVEELMRNPAFAQFKTAAAGGSYSQGGSGGSAKMEVYPGGGLPLVDDGWFNATGNIKAEMRIIGDSGAQAGMRVRMRVGLDDDGHAVLGGGSTIQVQYDLEKQEWVKGSPEWVAKQRHSVVGGPSMRDDVPVADAKEFKMFQGDVYSVNGPKFGESILKMYPTYARMAVVVMKSK